ncbi:MAG TPA: ABC transporter permease [Thermoanaerobaculia bacterium]|nr:ABC transporter permease [Thermoanaerobaculia bacterium]
MAEQRHTWPPLLELTLVRFREFIRQPEALFWVFAFPLILAIALGFAFRDRAPERIPVGVIEGVTEDLLVALEQSPALTPRIYPESAGREALRTGKISLLIDRDEAIVFVFDPTRPESRTARLETDDALQRAAGRKDLVPVENRESREPGSRYIDFLIPGLLGMNLMGTGMWGVGFSVATSRMQKLLKRLAATPMRKSDYFLSHMLSRLLFLFLEVVVIVAFGWIVFDVAVRGSILLLTVVSLIGAFTFCGLGLLTASRAQTIEGVSGLMNLVMVPMWILSGVFFSSERFPDTMQPFIKALPLTALNDALRAVMIEGSGLMAVAAEIGILALWCVLSFVVALRIFRWN